jgi:hypothetical protein
MVCEIESVINFHCFFLNLIVGIWNKDNGNQHYGIGIFLFLNMLRLWKLCRKKVKVDRVRSLFSKFEAPLNA